VANRHEVPLRGPRPPGPAPAARHPLRIRHLAQGQAQHRLSPVEVRAERHYYSVPYRLVGETVEVRLSAATVEVSFRHRRVASHVRSYGQELTSTARLCPS